MKHLFTFLLLLSFAGILKSQTVFDSFDTPIESNYTINNGGLSDNSRFSYFLEKEIVAEGEGALGLKYTVESIADWGGGCQLRLIHPDASGVWDLSDYESLSIDFFNKVPSNESGRAQVQILLFEASDVDDIANAGMRKFEWWYSFHKVLDRGEGWHTIELPLKDVGNIADDGDGGTGFWLTGWDGATGNGKLDLNKIRSIVIGLSISGPLDHKMINGEFILDNMRLMGKKTSSSGEELIESFDMPLENTDYRIVNFKSNDNSGINQSLDKSNVFEGVAALKMDYSIKSLEDWGSATTLAMQWNSELDYWDFSGYDSISFYLYNEIKSSAAGRAKLQFILNDKSDFAQDGIDNRREFWFSYLSPFDLEPGWNKITIPLKDVGQTAQSNPGSGFWLSGAAGHLGNEMLDLDKISGVGFSIVVAGPADNADVSGAFLVDKLHLVGKNTTTGTNTLKTETDGFRLEQNYPNPFRNETTLQFNISKQAKVKLSIFDVSGKAVNVLVNETLNSGEYKVSFRAEDFPSGVYYYQLRAGEYVDTKKLIVAR